MLSRNLLLLMLCSMFACFSCGEETFTVKVVDGVPNIHNSSPKWGDAPKVELEFVQKFGDIENEDENYILFKPVDLVKDSDQNVYILESGNATIKKFDKNGKYLLTIGRKGQGPGEMEMPYFMTISQDMIYVFDLLSMRLSIFDTEGQYLDGKIINPPFFEFESFRQNSFVVHNAKSSAKTSDVLSIVDSDFKLLKSFGGIEDHGDLGINLMWNSGFIGVNNKHEIFFTYQTKNEIRKYSADGELLLKIFRPIPFDVIEKPLQQKVTQSDGIERNIPKLSYVTKDAAVDHKERLWVMSFTEDIDIYRGEKKEDENKIITEMQIFNSDGHLLGILDMDKEFKHFRIVDDYVYLIEHKTEMVVYEYKIVEK